MTSQPVFSGPVPELVTRQLQLRAIRPDDLKVVYAGLSDREVTRYYDVHLATLEEARTQMQWFSRNERNGTGRWWAICDQRNPRDYSPMIGACGINADEPANGAAEIGYWLLPSYWGQGLASEAVAALVEHARTLGTLSTLLARVDRPNTGSSKILMRLGFTEEDAADVADKALDDDEVMYKLVL